MHALGAGDRQMRQSGLLTVTHMIAIQATLEQNNAGFRKLPGTTLKDSAGQVVYTPPQLPDEIVSLMRDLEHGRQRLRSHLGIVRDLRQKLFRE